MRRCRHGLSILSLLISVMIIGFLITSVPKEFWNDLNPAAQKKKVSAVRTRAQTNVWKLICVEADNAVSAFEVTHGRPPRSARDLRRAGLDLGKKGPWGGKLYVKKGYLRSTKNPKAKHRLF